MKAITLMSGGLDSILASRLSKDLGLELIALHTVSPFCLCNHKSSSGCYHGVSQISAELGIPLVTVNVAEEMLEIVKNPAHGYGSNMNPCIDCRILLFRKAKELMQKDGVPFVITGEVLGQRPMSQKLRTMRLIESEAGLEGLVVRPLSAKVLEPTIPEKEGWISRDKLFDINGRGRQVQMELAKKLGINDYPCPSGGCLLTDPGFSRRVRDLLKHGEFNLQEVWLLKAGRHFRLSPKAKLAVGRNQADNDKITGLARAGDYLFSSVDIPGPVALGRGEFTPELRALACAIVTRYCDLNGSADAEISCTPFGQAQDIIRSNPIDQGALERLRI